MTQPEVSPPAQPPLTFDQAGGTAQPSPAAEKPAAEKPAAEKPAAEKPAGAGSRTRARAASRGTVRPGARRKTLSSPDAAPEPDRIAVVLQTSRYTGPSGRAVARHTPVLVTEPRALELIDRGHARLPGVAEAAAAVIILD